MKIREKLFSIFIIFCAVLGIVSAVPALADTIGTISFIDGRVDILKAGMDTAVPLESGAPVSAGDVIRTKSNARAEITLADGTVIRLAQGSKIGLNSANMLNLVRGRMRTVIPSGNAGLEILTPNATAKTNGTDMYFIYESNSSWFYGVRGPLQAYSNTAPADMILVEEHSCVRIAPGVPMAGSCAYKDIDVEKYAWDTSTVENTPVVAQLPAEGTVYTYTPLSGRAVTTPSLPVPIAFEDLACPQCPPDGIPLIPQQEGQTIKMGDWERTDPCGACTPIETP